MANEATMQRFLSNVIVTLFGLSRRNWMLEYCRNKKLHWTLTCWDAVCLSPNWASTCSCMESIVRLTSNDLG